MTSHRLREIRKAKDLTQTELGRLIGADKHAISRLERGETKLTLDVASKIARAIDVTIAELVGEETAARLTANEATPYKPDDDDPFARLLDAQHDRKLFQAASDVLDGLGIRAGDVLLVDCSRAAIGAPKSLSVVIAEHTPEDAGGEPRTLLRQFVPPGLLTTNSTENNRMPVTLTSGARIIGVVLSWHRQF